MSTKTFTVFDANKKYAFLFHIAYFILHFKLRFL